MKCSSQVSHIYVGLLILVYNTDIEIPANGAEGPICAIDGVNGGRSLYIKDHLLVYCYNYLSKRTYIRSTQELAYKLWIS